VKQQQQEEEEEQSKSTKKKRKKEKTKESSSPYSSSSSSIYIGATFVTVGDKVLAYYNKSEQRAAVVETNLMFNRRSGKQECKVRFVGDGSSKYTRSLDQLFVVQKN
jgi:hypothetical protein